MANGITIHKSQGSTIFPVVVHIPSGKRPAKYREGMYVACSRATKLQDLFIVGEFTGTPLPGNDEVNAELTSLRENGFNFSLTFLDSLPHHYEKFYIHNISSFKLNREHFYADQTTREAKILAFLEPRTTASDTLCLPFHNLLHITPSTTHQSSDGILIFTKGM